MNIEYDSKWMYFMKNKCIPQPVKYLLYLYIEQMNIISIYVMWRKQKKMFN